LIYLDPSGDECNCEECQEVERFRVEQFDRELARQAGGSAIDPWEEPT
jgi:hypothetical protein